MAIVHLIPGFTYLKQQIEERDRRIALLEKELQQANAFILELSRQLDAMGPVVAPSGGVGAAVRAELGGVQGLELHRGGSCP